MFKFSFLIITIFNFSIDINQLNIEHQNIKFELNNGKINPSRANEKWILLQKKYVDQPISIEIYGWRALTFLNRNNTQEALYLFKLGLKKSIEFKNDSLQFKYLADLAGISRTLGDFRETEKYFASANNLFKSKPIIGKQIPEYTCAFFQNIGEYKQKNGDYSESGYYLNIAIEIANENNLEAVKHFIYGTMSINFLKKNDFNNAQSQLLKSISYQAAHEDITDKYIKLAMIFNQKKEWSEMRKVLDLANNNFRKSVKRKNGTVFPIIEMRLFIAEGQYQNGITQYSFADRNFKKAIQLGQENIKEKNIIFYLFETYKLQAIAEIYNKNFMSALQNLQKAHQYNSTNFKSENIAENPKLETIKYKNDAIEIYKEKIIALLAIFKKEGKKEYLEYALSTVNSVHELINYQRNSFQLEGSKLFLSEQAHAIYGLAIEAAYQKYVLTNDAKYIDLAFQYSEANKSVVLFESIKANEKSSFNGVPQSLIDQEIKAIKNMAIYENQLYKDTKNEDLWRKKLIDVTDQLAKLKAKFKKEYPKYYNYKYNNETIKIADLQSKLTINQSVIEYFLVENTLFTFLVSKASSKFIKQNLLSDFKSQIVLFRNKLIEKSIDENYQKLSFSIYSTLFPTSITQILTKEKTNHVKIVADGVLNQIPFESLLTRKPKSLKETNIYLLEKYVLGYLPSATMNWKQTQDKEATLWPKSYLGFAPQYKNGLDLPINQETVNYLTNNLSGESYLMSNATIPNFEKYSKVNTKLLHLSMHGGASANDPMESYLAFGTDSLFAHDIYTKSIPTDLAILDACETGVGQINNGEGVLNLARSFLHAGSQAVAMSLWKLTSSAETAAITKDFAKLVLDGSAKDEALTKAKLNYLEKHRNDLLLSHPFYWSPLIVIGNTQAIEPSYFVYWLILMSLLCVYCYSSRRKV